MARSFYCNHCGKKVSASSTRCPSCGRMFGAVLCPRCGFSGDSGLFAHGCPTCGYLEENRPPHNDETRRPGKSSFRWPQFSLLFYLLGIGFLLALIFFLISLL